MEVRTAGASRVSAQRDEFAFFNRKFIRSEAQVYIETFLFVLFFFEISGDLLGEFLKMAVNRTAGQGIPSSKGVI